MSVSKPKHAGDRDPIKQGNYKQYWTYRNEYNRDKNTRTNIYRSNTRHGGEQQGNPWQDNFKNVITLKQKTTVIKVMNHQEIVDTLVEVLISINGWTSSTETMIIPEIKDNDGINSFLVNSPSQ